MAKISNTISSAPGILNRLIIVLYKTTAPSTEVARIVKALPHNDPFNFQFNGIAEGEYIINIHESTDGVSLGNLRFDYFVSASSTGVTELVYFFLVDGEGENDPVDGATSFDSGLGGMTANWIFQEGFRHLEPGDADAPAAGAEVDFSDLSNVRLLGEVGGEPRAFASGQKWAISVAVDAATASPPATGDFTGMVDLTGDVITLDSSHIGKTLLITNTNAAQITNLPAIVPLSEGAGYLIVHDGGDLVNVEIKPASGTQIKFRGVSSTDSLLLGVGEWVKIVKKGSVWQVKDEGVYSWDRLGKPDAVHEVGPNQLIAKGDTFNGLVYKRIFRYIQSLPPGLWYDFATWNGNPALKCFFALDVAGNQFKAPNLTGMFIRFIKNPGGSDADRPINLPGGFQPGTVGEHSHSLPADDSGSENRQSLVATSNSDEGLSLTNLSGVHNPGGETRPHNFGMIAVINI